MNNWIETWNVNERLDAAVAILENGEHFGGTEVEDFAKSWDRPYGTGDYGVFGKNTEIPHYQPSNW